jgi:hypothetical protein
MKPIGSHDSEKGSKSKVIVDDFICCKAEVVDVQVDNDRLHRSQGKAPQAEYDPVAVELMRQIEELSRQKDEM